MLIEDLLKEYYTLKESQKDINEELSSLKDKILDYLDDHDVDVIKTNRYTAERKMITSTRINKEDMPQDLKDIISNKYSKSTTSSMLIVSVTGEKRTRRSRSRSRSRSRRSR